MVNDSDCNPGNTNVAVSSFVTTYARLHLYSFMDKIVKNGFDRLLYFDTDSILYIKRPNDSDVPTGDFLGDLTNEITSNYGSDSKAIRFVSACLKNHAFEII